jgi:DNA sulfur modification protein DndB
MNNVLTRLIVPALRARMGDWVYYVTFLRMRDIAARVHLATEVHQSATLNELMQRQLEGVHAEKIQNYLLNQPQRFFNSIVVGIYGGAPQWAELDIRDNQFLDADDLPEYIKDGVGLLFLEGSEKIFAIDGQHRVVGIRKAIEMNDSLGDEQVSVLFLAHRTDASGLERTRRLFTSLNRYAKPVSLLGKIALDEDDLIAIITRRLVETHPLFLNRVATVKGVNLSRNDKKNLTTIVALYKALDAYLEGTRWATLKRSRPDDTIINQYYSQVITLFNQMVKVFTPLLDLQSADPEDAYAAQQFRNEEGGHLLFRPIGLIMALRVLHSLIEAQYPLPDAIQRLAKVPMILGDEPWAGLLWNVPQRRMITAPENQKTATQLMFYACGGDLSTFKPKTTNEDLRKNLAGLLNRNLEDIVLPRFS